MSDEDREIKNVQETEPERSLQEGLAAASERLSNFADSILREMADDDEQIVIILDDTADNVRIIKESVSRRAEAICGREGESWGRCASYLMAARQRLQVAAAAAERALKHKDEDIHQ